MDVTKAKPPHMLHNVIKCNLGFISQHHKHTACVLPNDETYTCITKFYCHVHIVMYYNCSPHPPRVAWAMEAQAMCPTLET